MLFFFANMLYNVYIVGGSMKKIKMFVFSIFVFLLLMPVFALEKGHEYNYNGVNDIVGYSDGYYLLKNNSEIIKYDNNDKLLIKKRFNIEYIEIV